MFKKGKFSVPGLHLFLFGPQEGWQALIIMLIGQEISNLSMHKMHSSGFWPTRGITNPRHYVNWRRFKSVNADDALF